MNASILKGHGLKTHGLDVETPPFVKHGSVRTEWEILTNHLGVGKDGLQVDKYFTLLHLGFLIPGLRLANGDFLLPKHTLSLPNGSK